MTAELFTLPESPLPPLEQIRREIERCDTELQREAAARLEAKAISGTRK